MAVTKEMNAQQDRQKALENAMKQITKEFGAGSIMRLGEMGDKLDIEVIPTGSLALDIAVGVGGYPRGRVIEIYGPESSGKTTLALHAIAEAQKMGGVTAFIDAEHALDPVYAHHLGVDTKELLISQPDSGEQALSIAESLVRSGAVDMIVERAGEGEGVMEQRLHGRPVGRLEGREIVARRLGHACIGHCFLPGSVDGVDAE